MSSRRAGVVVLALGVAGCAAPYYATFAPLPATGEGTRVERDGFSLVVPAGWQLREGGDGVLLAAFEAPPANGRYQLYRRLAVASAPAVAAADDAAMAAAATALLRARRPDLEVRATGRTTVADREAWWLRGRVPGGAAGWFLETLDVLVPGDRGSLVVGFEIPEGQLDASRDGFLATAATLRTTLAAPAATAVAELAWFDRDRIGVRLPATWQRAADPGEALAVFELAGSDGRCDLTTATSAEGYQLDPLVEGYLRDQAPKWAGLRIQSVERARRSGHDSLRFRATFLADGETIVVDDTFVLVGNRMDRLLFRVPFADYAAQRMVIERAVASLQWR